MVRAALTLLVLGALMLVGAGITTAIGASVTNSVATSLTAGSTARLAADNATSGLGQLASQMPNIGLVLGAAAILAIIFGVLFASFSGAGGGRGRRE